MGYYFKQITALDGLNFQDCAVSSAGQYMFSAPSDGAIYVSSDYGQSWSESTSGTLSWESVTCSNSGQYVAAAVFGEYIYTSSDYGVTWTQRTSSGSRQWNEIASSSDGTKLAAFPLNGYIYTSTDSGVNWTQKATSKERYDIACSDDFSVIFAVGFTTVDKSTNSGVDWSELSLSGYDRIDCSSSGSIVYLMNSSAIKKSIDTGANWTDITIPESISSSILDVACSADGASVCFITDSDGIYLSEDGGDTWEQISNIVGMFKIAGDSTFTKLLTCAASPVEELYVGSLFNVSSITPDTGSTAGGTPVTIVGEGFDPAATAAIDGNYLTSVTVVDETTITGITPAGTLGSKDVTVTNP